MNERKIPAMSTRSRDLRVRSPIVEWMRVVVLGSSGPVGGSSKEVDERSNFITEEVHLDDQGRSYRVVAWTRRPLTAE
jgi:hypothetical protein